MPLLRILATIHILSWVAVLTLAGMHAAPSALASSAVFALFLSGILLSLFVLLAPKTGIPK